MKINQISICITQQLGYGYGVNGKLNSHNPMKLVSTAQTIEGRTVHFDWTPKKKFVKFVRVFGYGVTSSGQYTETEALEVAHSMCAAADAAKVHKM